jgi:hypothetical protein
MRLILWGLVLANGLFFAWSQGYLQAYGFAPEVQSEPHRVQQQIQPEAIVVLNTQDLKKAEAQALEDAKPKECVQFGPFDDAQVAKLRASLSATSLAAEAWQLNTVNVPERWVVYIGKFANAQALDKKRAELTALNIKSDAVTAPHLTLGLSLGRFDTEALANQDLERLRKDGVRTARVMQERAASQTTQLKLPAATDAIKSQVLALGDALAGKAARGCD